MPVARIMKGPAWIGYGGEGLIMKGWLGLGLNLRGPIMAGYGADWGLSTANQGVSIKPDQC